MVISLCKEITYLHSFKEFASFFCNTVSFAYKPGIPYAIFTRISFFNRCKTHNIVVRLRRHI